MAVPLDVVKTQNAGLKNLAPGQVGVFVGGTAGIGEFTLKAFARHMTSPKIYIVGRNKTSASRITDEVKTLNSDAIVVFVKADTSLLKNVDVVCKEIQSKEDKVNLLFLTTGYLAFEARNETSEGIDKRFSLNYYSRMRFVHNLLPQLTAAAASPNSISRVVSVLSAGHEGAILPHDLELKDNFTFSNCRAHGCVMNDLALEELAKANPGTAFVHTYPGFVRTGIMDHGGLAMKAVGVIVYALLWPMQVSHDESGERNLFHGSAALYPPKDKGGKDAAVGSDEVKGSGAYLLGWNGRAVGNQKVLGPLREQGIGKAIWEHTLEVFKRTTA